MIHIVVPHYFYFHHIKIPNLASKLENNTSSKAALNEQKTYICKGDAVSVGKRMDNFSDAREKSSKSDI